ncbi:ankyrin repeat domain-containing protein [Acidicapsa ligni]|uniref:ankyrin repeat domain-containing protein n=1 Tax=Acidicapsa ligni TaxID=542300 RepID=UPI0021DFBD7E|nr:ankyrin repeat domain-containing protein [Acidicapsa ligni]
MENSLAGTLIAELCDGRTDRVIDLIGLGIGADAVDADGVPLMRRCAYFGDVSAVRYLVEHGASPELLGDNFDLDSAAFHGHWQLCRFLIECGADVNKRQAESDETPLHAALCTTEREAHDRVLSVLLAAGADPNCKTKPDAETGGFMRDCRTKGETPLHRAAAFGTEGTIQMLLDAGAQIDAKDMHGDSPLSWGSWYLRPTPILRMLCYGPYRIHPRNGSMRENLLGDPHR